MNEEHTKYLFETYKFFRYDEWKDNRKEAIRYTLMPFGFECGDGWYTLIKCLCESIQNELDNLKWNRDYAKEKGEDTTDPKYNPIDNYTVIQVKEKYGTLRWYDSGFNDRIDGMTSMAEHMSSYICEECGLPGETLEIAGWWYTACKKCQEKLRSQYA
jgi:hypothetical protein